MLVNSGVSNWNSGGVPSFAVKVSLRTAELREPSASIRQR